LYCTQHYSADGATVTQQSIAVLYTTLFSRQCNISIAIYRCNAHHIIQLTVHCNTTISRCIAHHIIQQSEPLKHIKLSLYCTPHYSADGASVTQQTIVVQHTTLFSRQCNCSTAVNRCTAHHIIQQTVPLKHSNLSLCCTPHYSAESATLAE